MFRLTLLGVPPTLSDDIYRYLWDARVQHAGINPYRYAPSDPALAALRTPDYEPINHKDIPTIYPPLMQLAFRVGTWLSPTIQMQKVVFLVCDLAIMGLLVLWLPRWGVNPLMSLIYAWHPLVIVEVAASGHNDPLGVFWLVVGLALWRSRRKAAATIAFALTFLSKFTTALLWPFYVVRARTHLLVFFATVAVAGVWCWCSPYFTPGLEHYSRHWEFNSSLYRVIESLVGNPLGARMLCGISLVLISSIIALRTDDLTEYTVRALQAAILLAPVLEPWYLLWLIPLLCIRLSWAWLVFSGLVMLSYTVLVRFVHEGIWQIPLWAKWMEYGPLYAWLIWRGWKMFTLPSSVRDQRVA